MWESSISKDPTQQQDSENHETPATAPRQPAASNLITAFRTRTPAPAASYRKHREIHFTNRGDINPGPLTKQTPNGMHTFCIAKDRS